MDVEQTRRAEQREPQSWVRSMPFTLVGLVATPFVMAFTGMPEGGRNDLLAFAIVVAIIGALAGYFAGTVHGANQATNDLLWLWAGFVMGLAVKILYDGLIESSSIGKLAEGLSLGLIYLGGLGLVVGGVAGVLMRSVGLAVQSRTANNRP